MITVENLVKTFRGRGETLVALDGVSLEVPQGTVCGVVGQSGAGKSTLARCVALLEKPDAGAIRVDGTDLVSLSGAALRAARRKIGVVPQGDSLLRQRTAAGNVALPLESAGAARLQRRARVLELLELVGLADKGPAPTRTSSPAVSGSAWRSPGRWPAARRCCWPTSRPRRWTRRPRRRCWACWTGPAPSWA
nr:hypothetical protein GCM10020241_29070 [Streptoalloteichus tenebrarius]